MARARTTFDPFNAVAEPKRRKVLEAIGNKELPVNDIVDLLGWPQPMISKHLGVLKKVGLVRERRVGRQRFYRVNAEQLKPIYDWTQHFQELWDAKFDQLDKYLKELQQKERRHGR
jgi:DNA-binding transcriptional ArsR family regulator